MINQLKIIGVFLSVTGLIIWTVLSHIPESLSPQLHKRQTASVQRQLQSIDSKKPTVCTITIGSADEKKAFKASLKNEFNFVELVTKDINWFQKACEQKVQCDVLLVSGHFGGGFFSLDNDNRLSLSELQIQSCYKQCDGILNKPKEVFLFGCNTTAGKRQDHRTPEQYVKVLIEDGFSRSQAEMVAAFRYSEIGQETGQKMQRIFSNARIYGFHSQSPLGKYMGPRLSNYFKQIPNYVSHLQNFDPQVENTAWTQVMTQQYIASLPGRSSEENPFCILNNKETYINKKIQWINSALSNEKTALSYVPVVNEYLEYLEYKHGPWGEWRKAGLRREGEAIEKIQYNDAAKEQVTNILTKPMGGMLFAQLEVLNFAQRVGWYNDKEYSHVFKNLTNDLLKKDLDVESRNLLCSSSSSIDITLDDLPSTSWNLYTIEVIGCSRTSRSSVQLALIKYLKSKNKDIRHAAGVALYKSAKAKKIKDPQVIERMTQKLWENKVSEGIIIALGHLSGEPKVQQALARALKAPKKETRFSAGRTVFEAASEMTSNPWTQPHVLPVLKEAILATTLDNNHPGQNYALGFLNLIKFKDQKTLAVLLATLKSPHISIRKRGARALGVREIKDPDIHSALIKNLIDKNKEVRIITAWALGQTKGDNLEVQQALLKRVVNDSEIEVRNAAAWALTELKLIDVHIHMLGNIVVDRKQHHTTRAAVAKVLGSFNFKDTTVLLNLVKALKDQDPVVGEYAAQSLFKIKPNDRQVLKEIKKALRSSNLGSQSVSYLKRIPGV